MPENLLQPDREPQSFARLPASRSFFLATAGAQGHRSPALPICRFLGGALAGLGQGLGVPRTRSGTLYTSGARLGGVIAKPNRWIMAMEGNRWQGIRRRGVLAVQILFHPCRLTHATISSEFTAWLDKVFDRIRPRALTRRGFIGPISHSGKGVSSVH